MMAYSGVKVVGNDCLSVAVVAAKTVKSALFVPTSSGVKPVMRVAPNGIDGSSEQRNFCKFSPLTPRLCTETVTE